MKEVDERGEMWHEIDVEEVVLERDGLFAGLSDS